MAPNVRSVRTCTPQPGAQYGDRPYLHTTTSKKYRLDYARLDEDAHLLRTQSIPCAVAGSNSVESLHSTWCRFKFCSTEAIFDLTNENGMPKRAVHG
ncbi:hypothetical protein CDAR_198771 [Caerostris darwini]|uniref:Uncharacterized protein n=1 Tax=Caerostris darwini TaxID=1538125 RepID=A0AAV4W3J3_9ARAC|nr:hypothetical protein CDAR_198771 [Caerostris darwini]